MNDPGRQKLHYRETESTEQLRSRKLHIYLRELLFLFFGDFSFCLFVLEGRVQDKGTFNSSQE